MNQLWSPWRMEYINNGNKEEGCVFCNAQAMQDGSENLIAHRGRLAYVILNRFPYTSGHLMVIPFQHLSSLEELNPETRAEMMELTSQCTTVLKSIYRPQGFNVGVNIGEAAGAYFGQELFVEFGLEVQVVVFKGLLRAELAFDQALAQDVGLSLGALVLDEHLKEFQVRELLFLGGLIVLFERLEHSGQAQVLEFVFELLHDDK